MLKTTVLGLATVASLSLGAAALTPALANYAACTEDPEAKGCPGYITPAPDLQGSIERAAPKRVMHAQHHPVEHPTNKG